ncbi:hypothetical protein [Hymenobacter bucti]|uniref:Outer membrane protein beta-barrel domain-containing protein n=1 Tax=Hymenobacter bucti TaxID=1844114 RepID=A0ABW4QPN5_9BACT
MKYLLLALPATLLATQAFGQHIEYSARANAGFSAFRGANATTTTTVSTSTTDGAESSRAVNPYGKRLGTGAGISLRAQRVGKAGLLTAFDLGFDWMQARTDVNAIYYSSASTSYSRPATGTVHLYTPSITAFLGAGWRLGGEKLALDAVVGPELAYVLNAREIGEGSSSVNGGWRTDLSRAPANRLDFRLRGDLTVWRNRVGLLASYSLGFANYQAATTSVPSPDAAVRVARVGLAYRFK